MAVALTAQSTVWAQDEASETDESESLIAFSASASVDILSDYMWRGVIYSDLPVWQPSVSADLSFGDYGTLGFNLWSSFDATHRRTEGLNSRKAMGWQENDYTLSYSATVGPVDVSVGHIWYTYPKRYQPTDQELYLTVAYGNDYVTPEFSAYWNYNDTYGNDPAMLYYEAKLSREFELYEGLTLTPYARIGMGSVGWVQYYTERPGSNTQLTEQTLGISAAYAITSYLSVGGQINYTWTPSHTLRHDGYMADDKDQLVWGGVNFSLSF